MSEVLAVLRKAPGGCGSPTLRVRCAACARVYVTTTPVQAAQALTRCWACRYPGEKRRRNGGTR